MNLNFGRKLFGQNFIIKFWDENTSKTSDTSSFNYCVQLYNNNGYYYRS
jgi:hypothetical protein